MRFKLLGQGTRKTRLCEKFMTQGHCPYGDKCTFAHGYAEVCEAWVCSSLTAGSCLTLTSAGEAARVGRDTKPPAMSSGRP